MSNGHYSRYDRPRAITFWLHTTEMCGIDIPPVSVDPDAVVAFSNLLIDGSLVQINLIYCLGTTAEGEILESTSLERRALPCPLAAPQTVFEWSQRISCPMHLNAAQFEDNSTRSMAATSELVRPQKFVTNDSVRLTTSRDEPSNVTHMYGDRAAA